MIYVHVPFCRSFCTYCGFYSERACPTEAWADEVCREAEARREEITAASAVDTLYFGGGTPSVLPPSVLGRIADACGGRSYREWTVEVNPDDITPSYAAELRALGVNRVSMGVQSLDDGILRWMNRRHSADGARSAFRMLREAGFDNISVDVIFGVAGMSAAVLEDTVRELLEWRPEHISAYQLSIEEGSALDRLVREGRYAELPDEACEAQYRLICRLLAAAGYEHYEISNWALPGRRAVHNSAYWTRSPYVGLGGGAHSLWVSGQGASVPDGIDIADAGVASGAEIPWPPAASEREGPAAKQWEGRSEQSEQKVLRPSARRRSDIRSWNSEAVSGWKRECEVLTADQVREEEIMLALRTADGVPAELLEGSLAVASLVPSALPGRLRIPEDRWFVADDIIASLI